MSAIFGSPSQSNQSSISNSASSSNNSSSNQAYQTLLSSLSSQLGNSTSASNTLAGLLGVGGDPTTANQGFQNFQDSTGYQFGLNQGTQAITQNAAASGLLNSGATAKALDTYGQNYANTQYQNYLNPLMNLVNGGNQAGSVIGSSGQVSNGTSQSQSTGTSNGSSTGAKQGLAGLAGGIASGIASGGMTLPAFFGR